MSLFSSKSKEEIEVLIEENDELKNTLHYFVQKHTSLTDLDIKINEASENLDKLRKESLVKPKKYSELEIEIKTKHDSIVELEAKI